jgi:hypothetical protein
MPKFSEEVAKEKLGLIHRALHSDPDTAHAADGILSRAVRYSLAFPCVGQSACMSPPASNAERNERHLFLDTSISLLGDSDITYRKGGSPMLRSLNCPISSLNIPEKELFKLAQLGMFTVGDITCISNPGRRTPLNSLRLNDIALKYAPSLRVDLSSFVASYRFHEGMCWYYTCVDYPKPCVVEVIGYASPTQLMIRIWVRSSGTNTVTLRKDSLSLGSGTNIHMDIDDLFPLRDGLHTQMRVILSADILDLKVGGGFRRIIGSFEQYTPLFRNDADSGEPPDVMNEWDHTTTQIAEHISKNKCILYTDGEWGMPTAERPHKICV